MTTETVYKCFFDGACEPKNPGGNMGIGALIYSNETVIKTHSEYISASPANSNNVAEYLGILWVLETLLQLLPDQAGAKVEIKGDSKLVVMQLTGLWKIKKGLYASYATEARGKLAELKKVAEVAITWIPGHTNIEADKLSRRDITESSFLQRTEAKERKFYSNQKIKYAKNRS